MPAAAVTEVAFRHRSAQLGRDFGCPEILGFAIDPADRNRLPSGTAEVDASVNPRLQLLERRLAISR